MSEDHSNEKVRVLAGYLSLAVAIVLTVFKFWAYRITNSTAVFSDALESIVNVLGAAVALFVIYYSAKPADKDHPYGHGKSEYFSSAFEGGLISFAGLFIVIDATTNLFTGHELRQLDLGLIVVAVAGAVNLLLGLFLLTVGKKVTSSALQASGHHVISDFWTSFGILIALGLIHVTGWVWLDSAVAIIVGFYLSYNGFKIFRESLSGLMDGEDTSVLQKLASAMEKASKGRVIQVHHVRVIRSGREHHIDGHIVVPEFWDVATAHEHMVGFEKRVIKEYGLKSDMNLHLDPCRKAYCEVCDVDECPIRIEEFKERRPFSLDELTSLDEPSPFRDPNHSG